MVCILPMSLHWKTGALNTYPIACHDQSYEPIVLMAGIYFTTPLDDNVYRAIL